MADQHDKYRGQFDELADQHDKYRGQHDELADQLDESVNTFVVSEDFASGFHAQFDKNALLSVKSRGVRGLDFKSIEAQIPNSFSHHTISVAARRIVRPSTSIAAQARHTFTINIMSQSTTSQTPDADIGIEPLVGIL